nr:hypothetical protein [bacterium]
MAFCSPVKTETGFLPDSVDVEREAALRHITLVSGPNSCCPDLSSRNSIMLSMEDKFIELSAILILRELRLS